MCQRNKAVTTVIVAQKLPNGGGLADVNQGSGWRGNLNRGGKTHRIVVVLDKTCTLAISGGNKPIRKRPKASKPALCFQVERSLSALLKKRVRLGASTPLWLCELLFVPPPCRVRDRFSCPGPTPFTRRTEGRSLWTPLCRR